MRASSRRFSCVPLLMCLAVLSCGSNGPMGTSGTGGAVDRGTGGSGVAAGGTGGSGAGGPGGGAGQGAPGGGGGESAFAPVQAIFDVHCAGCHDPAHPIVRENPTYVEMPLVSGQSYDALIGVAAHETCGGTRVVPGDPEHSYLYRKIVDANPCDGARMPTAGNSIPQPLAAEQIATIHDWIAAGARP